MLRFAKLLAALCCLCNVQASRDSPRIIIIGSGPASLAAGARLLENGFDNLTILEAEDRIGGRLYATEFGGYPVDVGGQWVAGEEKNAVLELVWPMGLLEKSSDDMFTVDVLSSAGTKMAQDAAESLIAFYVNLTETELPEQYKDKTIGDWYVAEFEEYFKNHPEITTEQRGPLLKLFCKAEMADYAGDDWFKVSTEKGTEHHGDQAINWKDKTYGFLIEILLKKYPNPAEELPYRNKTILNAEVARISYNNPDGAVRVVTEKGDEYVADHVIFTPSLGVLKADHEKLFDPPLPETKINAIKAIEFGSVAKIYLSYPEPWWPQGHGFAASFYWTEEDENAFANDPEKSWLLGLYGVFTVEHKPGLLLCWMSGVHAREMENVTEENVLKGTKELFQRFLGKSYNLTEPSATLRSRWFTNKHFRGTYSYRSPKTDELGATPAQLGEPIMDNEHPKILFAGEATSPTQYATVNGAVSSGWREADRLIKAYADEKAAPETRR